MENQLIASITVFNDAAKAEIVGGWKRVMVGWFQDEVSAIGAVCERLIMDSAMLPQLRKLPPLAIACEYRKMNCGHEPQQFRRATVAKPDNILGRRIVMLPGPTAKDWLSGSTLQRASV